MQRFDTALSARPSRIESQLSEDAMTKWSCVAGVLAAVSLHACAVEKKPPAVESGKAVVQAYIDAWNKRDSVAIDTLLGPDAIHEDFAQNFRGRGSDAIVKFMRAHVAVQPDFKLQVTNSIEEGRYVALEWTWTGTYTGPDPTGKPVTNRRISGTGASYVELEKGKIKRFSDYFDLASFFR
jgi:steroid delta-isomerase-like uncharacterized protein